MSKQMDRVLECLESVKEKAACLTEADAKTGKVFTPHVALVLGSGLGDLADEIEVVDRVNYSDISGFPQSTVSGHKGRFVFGYIRKTPVVIMQGRVHYYEGYPMEDVVLPIRLMKMMGAKVLFVTNAAGGISYKLKPGTLMMLTDQIASFIPSPLIGPNDDDFGTRFPDMSEIYNKELQLLIRKCAVALDIDLQEGIYIQFTGPQYETPAEVRMARTLGADACGMSTACETLVANHMGMQICGISCITNLASGISATPLNHQEVKETADRVSKEFKALVTRVVSEMGESL